MTRLVLDTNVLVSGLLFGGAAGRLLKLMWAGRYRLATATEVEAEITRVLTYPRFGLSRQEVNIILDQYVLPFSDRFAVRHGPPVCRDADDDKFLHCALTARARAIVSSDKNILAVGPAFRGNPILTIRQAMREIGR